jgi:cytochrome b561
MLRNSISRWGGVAKLFHWVIVVLIVTQYVLANQASGLPLGLRKLVVLAQHKSFGMTILALAVLRLLWRWANPVPALPANMKPWERAGAHVSHWALYGLLFALPLTGWLMSSAKNYPVSWFNLFAFPNLVGANDAVYHAMLSTHHVLAKVLFAVALLHMLAALQHHFLRKDHVLRDMLPFGRSRTHS